MKIRVGTDILYLPRFEKSFLRYPEKFQRDIFCASELEDQRIEHLAGIFAAKEAVMKALDMKPGFWKLIEIRQLRSGKLVLALSPDITKKDIVNIDRNHIVSFDISISHQEDYVVAVAVLLIKTKN